VEQRPARRLLLCCLRFGSLLLAFLRPLLLCTAGMGAPSTETSMEAKASHGLSLTCYDRPSAAHQRGAGDLLGRPAARLAHLLRLAILSILRVDLGLRTSAVVRGVWP
jgi:hypothetical protein